MSAVITLKQCAALMAEDLYRDPARAAEATGYAQVYEHPAGIKVFTRITSRRNPDPSGKLYPGAGARAMIRIEASDGSVIAQSEDATFDWFEAVLP